MTTLINILDEQEQLRHATDTGVKMHAYLQHIVIDGDCATGNPDLVARIKAHPEMLPFFGATARTEVPIAGTINGQFISRRIDRLCIDDNAKTIAIIDYKTDVNPERFYEQYLDQINEYAVMLRRIYPDYTISGYILWTHDFRLEQIQINQI